MYDATFKVVVLGEAGVGKTTFTKAFLWGRSIFPIGGLGLTIGVDSDVRRMYIDGKYVKLEVWDFSGEERFRFLMPTYVRSADGAFLMYDVTNYSSLTHLDDWLLVIRSEMKSKQDAFPIALVGNRADLVEDREVTRENGINFAKSKGLQGFIECSAKTGENIEKAFIGLTKIMLYQKMLESKVDGKDILDDNSKPEKKTEVIYKVILIGDPSVGKTRLIANFCGEKFEYVQTVGVNITKERVKIHNNTGKNTEVSLMIWDIAGQPQFYMLHKPYFNRADGMILTFDITRSSSFSNINNWNSIAINYGLSGIPKILVGIKKHLNSEEERRVILPMAQKLSERLGAPYFEVSLATGENINLALQKIAELIYRRDKEIPQSHHIPDSHKAEKSN